MHPNDTAPNVSRMRSRLSFRSNAKPTPVERVPVTTPSIAEAVLRSTHRVCIFSILCMQKNMTASRFQVLC